MYTLEEIKILHLEITQKCQASCLQCDRNTKGGDINPHLTNSELTLQQIKELFPPKFIKQLNTMYMCGNHGDPAIAKYTLEVFKYFRENNENIWLSMNTNGGVKTKEWWSELANIIGKMGAVIFSFDGLEDTNHLYRQGVNWNNCIENSQAFIDSGGRARWDYIVFEHNEHQIDIAKKLSESMGFEKFQVKKTGRFLDSKGHKKESHQGINHKGEYTQKLEKPNKNYINESLKKYDKIEKEYGNIDNYYDETEIICKVQQEKSIYVTAEGYVLPCCWIGSQMYKWYENKNSNQVWKFISDDNINKFNKETFDNIKESWNCKSVNEGKLKICSMKCGKKLDPFKDQFK